MSERREEGKEKQRVGAGSGLMEMVADGDAGAAPARRQEGQAAEASGGCRGSGSAIQIEARRGYALDWLVFERERNFGSGRKLLVRRGIRGSEWRRWDGSLEIWDLV